MGRQLTKMTKTELIKFRHWMRACLREHLKNKNRNLCFDKDPIPDDLPEFDFCNINELSVSIEKTHDIVSRISDESSKYYTGSKCGFYYFKKSNPSKTLCCKCRYFFCDYHNFFSNFNSDNYEICNPCYDELNV